MNGMKSQITAIAAILFAVVNAVFPAVLTPEQESKILEGLVAVYALFMAMKVSRNKGEEKK